MARLHQGAGGQAGHPDTPSHRGAHRPQGPRGGGNDAETVYVF